MQSLATPLPPRGKAAPSPAHLSALIGEIYDCAIDPGKWQATLLKLNDEFRFSSSIVGIVPLNSPKQIVNVSVGFDDDWLSKTEGYTADSVELWGGAEHIQDYPLDEPIVASRTRNFAKRFSNRYFTEVLAPRGLIDAIAIAVARQPSLIGYIGFNRHRSMGAIRNDEVEGLRLLGPHFRRAVTISNLLDLKSMEAATFTSALDVLAFGAVLVDEEMRIVHANPAAEAMLADGGPIQSSGGRLTVAAPASQAALESAARQSAVNEAELGQRGIGIPATDKRGKPAMIHLLPLRRGDLRPGLVQRAVAALFIVSPANPPGAPTDALAFLYDLTPAETRVFELVCAGMTAKEIGRRLGISLSTIKTHLVRVFQKTGCNRQIDLVQLAARLSLPV